MKLLLKSLILSLALTTTPLFAGDATPDAAIAMKLADVREVANAGPFEAKWDSLADYEIPEWYKDAKFGIFIHWGMYSVPGFGNEWYPREMYRQENSRRGIYEHHQEKYGANFGYKDFIPMFKAENFDPDAWAQLFKDAGARYVVPVAEHHDGFPMYNSDYTHWDAAEMGPKRDIISDLSKSIRAAGLHFGVSSHRAEHWWFYGGGRELPNADVNDDSYRSLYGPARDRDESETGVTIPDQAFLDDWLLRSAELVDKFEPDLIWFDWWIASPPFSAHLQTFSSYYYNRGKTFPNMVAINYKAFGGESFPDTAGVLDIERGGLADIRELLWQTDTSVSKNSWGYVSNHDYKTVNSLIDDLVDIVSKNGCMLLNIGPKPDGTIPQKEQDMLLEMGAWLMQNGEAIYGSRTWDTFGEGATKVKDGKMHNDAEGKRKDFNADDVRFTTQGNTVYATILAWPGDGAKFTVRSFTSDALKGIEDVSMIGAGQLGWKQDANGLHVTLPKKAPGQHAYVLKIER
jgi:alpha-L-fucosidase